MRHLSDETLARLVDEPPTGVEEEHLRTCRDCAGALGELREQTEALATLPELRPPAGDWSELESRLIDEGLVRRAELRGTASSGRPGVRTAWLQAAAAVVLFLGGTGFGVMTARAGNAAENGSGAGAVSGEAVATGPAVSAGSSFGSAAVSGPAPTSPGEAAAHLRSAEERYVDALLAYRELMRSAGGSGWAEEDPASRFAALETLVAASQAAIRQAPADPFFNGVLASAMAERQAALRQISTSDDDNWF